MKKLFTIIIAIILICGTLTSCDSKENSNKNNSEGVSTPTIVYTEEQLQALGKVMVCGDYVGFAVDKKTQKNEVALAAGSITFVDEDLNFAALGHVPTNPISSQNKKIYDLKITSEGVNGIDAEYTKKTFANLDEHFSTVDGLFGRLNEFVYDTSREMEFGIPVQHEKAQLFLVRPENKSGWYDIYIEAVFVDSGTQQRDFIFSFTDEKLPSNYDEYTMEGRSGSPIIQHGKLVGAYSGTTGYFKQNTVESATYHRANFAADMQFLVLRKYDPSFNDEIFRDVPTLKDYFD